MRETLTIRLPREIARWLEAASDHAGLSKGEIVRQHLEQARNADPSSRKFMRLAGSVRRRPRNLSTRKGFAKR